MSFMKHLIHPIQYGWTFRVFTLLSTHIVKLYLWKLYSFLTRWETVSFLISKLKHDFRLMGGWVSGWLVGLDISTYIKCVGLFCRRLEFCRDLRWIGIYSTSAGKVLHACMHSFEYKYHSYNKFSSSIIIVSCTYYMYYHNYFRVHSCILVPGSQQYMVQPIPVSYDQFVRSCFLIAYLFLPQSWNEGMDNHFEPFLLAFFWYLNDCDDFVVIIIVKIYWTL